MPPVRRERGRRGKNSTIAAIIADVVSIVVVAFPFTRRSSIALFSDYMHEPSANSRHTDINLCDYGLGQSAVAGWGQMGRIRSGRKRR